VNEKRDVYVRKLKSNIDKWNSEIDKLQIKADQAKAETKVKFRKQIADLKVKRRELEGEMADLRKAGEAAWQDVKSGVDVVKVVLGESIKSAKSRFK